jgi:hypothetical protein
MKVPAITVQPHMEVQKSAECGSCGTFWGLMKVQRGCKDIHVPAVITQPHTDTSIVPNCIFVTLQGHFGTFCSCREYVKLHRYPQSQYSLTRSSNEERNSSSVTALEHFWTYSSCRKYCDNSEFVWNKKYEVQFLGSVYFTYINNLNISQNAAGWKKRYTTSKVFKLSVENFSIYWWIHILQAIHDVWLLHVFVNKSNRVEHNQWLNLLMLTHYNPQTTMVPNGITRDWQLNVEFWNCGYHSYLWIVMCEHWIGSATDYVQLYRLCLQKHVKVIRYGWLAECVSINILYIFQHGSRAWFSESVLFLFLFNIYFWYFNRLWAQFSILTCHFHIMVSRAWLSGSVRAVRFYININFNTIQRKVRE